MLARGDGDPKPTDMEMVKADFGAAMKLTSPGGGENNAAPSAEPVVVLVAHGRFTRGGSVPPGTKPAAGVEI